MLPDAERRAVERDAISRLVQLRAGRRRLWADRDDADVALELHAVISEIRGIESELGLNRQRHPARSGR